MTQHIFTAFTVGRSRSRSRSYSTKGYIENLVIGLVELGEVLHTMWESSKGDVANGKELVTRKEKCTHLMIWKPLAFSFCTSLT